MLVVSRKANQSLMIGNDIEVVILESKDGYVKIGIDAPRGIKIYRKEIYEDIKSENSQALETDMGILKKILKDE